jgi:ABC-type hemin transport system substrate-binding protein
MRDVSVNIKGPSNCIEAVPEEAWTNVSGSLAESLKNLARSIRFGKCRLLFLLSGHGGVSTIAGIAIDRRRSISVSATGVRRSAESASLRILTRRSKMALMPTKIMMTQGRQRA